MTPSAPVSRRTLLKKGGAVAGGAAVSYAALGSASPAEAAVIAESLGFVVITNTAYAGGAVADGYEADNYAGTDNWAALVAARDVARAQNRPVFIPSTAAGRAFSYGLPNSPGSGDIGDWTGITVIGQDARRSVLCQRDKTRPVLTWGGQNCELKNLWLARPVRTQATDRPSGDTTDKNICGLRLGRVGIGAKIHRVETWRSRTGFYLAEPVGTQDSSYLSNCVISDCRASHLSTGGVGFRLTPHGAGSTAFVFQNIYVNNGGTFEADILHAGFVFGTLDELDASVLNLEWLTAVNGIVLEGVGSTHIRALHAEGFKAGGNGAIVHVAADANSKMLRLAGVNIRASRFDKTLNGVTDYALVKAERGISVEIESVHSTGANPSSGTTATEANQSTMRRVVATSGVTRAMRVGLRHVDPDATSFLNWAPNDFTAVPDPNNVTVINRDVDDPDLVTVNGVSGTWTWDARVPVAKYVLNGGVTINPANLATGARTQLNRIIEITNPSGAAKVVTPGVAFQNPSGGQVPARTVQVGGRTRFFIDVIDGIATIR